MKTPHQLKEAERKREATEAKLYRQRLESQLERAINGATLTSEGGTFTFSGFNIGNLPQIQQYCHKHGWDVQYTPYRDSGFSMTTRSEYEYTIHQFKLTPSKGK